MRYLQLPALSKKRQVVFQTYNQWQLCIKVLWHRLECRNAAFYTYSRHLWQLSIYCLIL